MWLLDLFFFEFSASILKDTSSEPQTTWFTWVTEKKF